MIEGMKQADAIDHLRKSIGATSSKKVSVQRAVIRLAFGTKAEDVLKRGEGNSKEWVTFKRPVIWAALEKLDAPTAPTAPSK